MNVLLLCSGMLILLVVLAGFIALLRYLQYRDTIDRAEKGLSLQEKKTGKPLFRLGIFLTILGLALTLGLYILGSNAQDSYPLHLGPWMLGGLVPLFLGLGLVLLHYVMEGK